MAQGTLPQEIILLVCDELTLRRDFPTLFQLSLVSRRVASIALEKLYRYTLPMNELDSAK